MEQRNEERSHVLKKRASRNGYGVRSCAVEHARENRGGDRRITWRRQEGDLSPSRVTEAAPTKRSRGGERRFKSHSSLNCCSGSITEY